MKYRVWTWGHWVEHGAVPTQSTIMIKLSARSGRNPVRPVASPGARIDEPRVSQHTERGNKK
jgi:hypothetical protein